MPASHPPTDLERSGLQQLLGIPELDAAKLQPVGDRTIKPLLAKGWIERGSADRVTPDGESALREPNCR
jgi:hypothetical protein